MGATSKGQIKRVYRGKGICKSSSGLWMYTKLVKRDANGRIRSVCVEGLGICDGLSVRVRRTVCGGFRIVLRQIFCIVERGMLSGIYYWVLKPAGPFGGGFR